MSILFLQTTAPEPSWVQLVQYGPTVVILALLLWFALRLAPIWKEVKVRELDLRADENVVKREQTVALASLADVIKDIALIQRKATENIEIMQRVNADSNDRVVHAVQSLTERVDKVEETQGAGALKIAQELITRVAKLEGNNHVESESTRA